MIEFVCIGETITDAEIVEHVLMALPKSFYGLVNTLMYRPTLPIVAELIMILLQVDIQREIKGNRRSDHEALLIKSTSKKNHGGHKTNSGGEDDRHRHKKGGSGECHYCGSKETLYSLK